MSGAEDAIFDAWWEAGGETPGGLLTPAQHARAWAEIHRPDLISALGEGADLPDELVHRPSIRERVAWLLETARDADEFLAALTPEDWLAGAVASGALVEEKPPRRYWNGEEWTAQRWFSTPWRPIDGSEGPTNDDSALDLTPKVQPSLEPIDGTGRPQVSIERAAQDYYEGWRTDEEGTATPSWVPWVPGGNSDKQEEARRLARNDVRLGAACQHSGCGNVATRIVPLLYGTSAVCETHTEPIDGSGTPCDYCGDPAWLYSDGTPHTDPFGDRPCCRPCFDQIVDGSGTP